jgi:protocatechuate 3,4-dioxygenase beta subunit
MKNEIVSIRRRQVLAAGAAGMAAPAVLAAQRASGAGGTQPLVVSGRVIGADRKPLAGALVEVWQADADFLPRATVTTDADGRYFFNTVLSGEYPERPRRIHYRVSHQGHSTLATPLYFTPERGAPQPLMINTTRDEQGAMRAAFEVTLERAA